MEAVHYFEPVSEVEPMQEDTTEFVCEGCGDDIKTRDVVAVDDRGEENVLYHSSCASRHTRLDGCQRMYMSAYERLRKEAQKKGIEAMINEAEVMMSADNLEAREDPTEPQDDTIGNILDERGETHGDYLETSALCQAIRRELRNHALHKFLDAGMAEALDEISLKMARIVIGNPWKAEHWNDIQGYARLVTERYDLK